MMADDQPTDPLADPRHRQFDFWLGTWDVRQPDGSAAGRNRIERLFDGCGLAEHWEGASGLRGASYSAFDTGRATWHQTWIDSSGSVLLLDGGMGNDAMVLEGRTESAAGDSDGALRHRISWSVTDVDGDELRQHWQVSRDEGATWTTAFDGRYTRRPR